MTAIEEASALAANEWLIGHICHKRKDLVASIDMDLKDIKQELRLSMLLCVRNYKPDKSEVSFQNYTAVALVRRLKRLRDHTAATIEGQGPSSLDTTCIAENIAVTKGARLDENHAIDELSDMGNKMLIESGLKLLDERTRAMFKLVIEGYGAEEIAAIYDLSSHHIRYLLRKGYTKIRKGLNSVKE